MILADVLLVIAMLGGICYLYIALIIWLKLLRRHSHSLAKYVMAAGASVMLSGVSLSLVAFLLQPYIELLFGGLFLSFIVAFVLAGSVGSPGFWVNWYIRHGSRRR